MMRAIFVFLLLLGAIWLGLLWQHDPGYILITIQHWTIETTIWMGCIVLLIVYVLLYIILRLLSAIINARATWKTWRAKVRDNKAHSITDLTLLMYLYKDTNNWHELLNLLPTIKKHRILSSHEYKQLTLTTYQQLFMTHMQNHDATAMQLLIQNLPRELSKQPSIAVLYCRYLLDQRNIKEATTRLQRSLRKSFNEELITLYGELSANEANLGFLESLLKEHDDSAALLLCLGKICHEKKLWGKAKVYLQNSIQLHPTPSAWFELGRLFESMEDKDSACYAYRSGLKIVS